MKDRLPAVILAGGRATRMGGGDKGLKLLAGRPMLAQIIERLRPQVGPIALNANGDPARFKEFGLPVIRDTISGFVGPLAGILAGMEWASQSGNGAYLISVAGDTPFFPADLVEKLEVATCGGDKIGLASSAGRTHPVFGLWPLALRDDLVDFLAAGASFKVANFAERHDHVIVDFPLAAAGGRTIDPFFNVNTAADLEAAEAVCKTWEQ
jgi:molybdopterin-guanine dinucleotide biosynthesis protein A